METCSNGTQNGSPPVTLPSPSNPFAALDILVPGFSTISTVISTYAGIDLNVYIPSIVLLFASAWASQAAWTFISRLFSKHLMSTVEIRIDDEMYNYVMGWIALQPFSSKSKMFIAQSSTNSKNWQLWYLTRNNNKDDEEEDEEIEKDADGLPVPKGKKEKPLAYTPGMGTHLFWWKYRPYLFHRWVPGNRQRYESPSETEEISISSFGRDPVRLKELLVECRAMSCKADKDKTLIYRGSSKPGSSGSEFTWIRSLSRVARPMSSVVMDETIKRELLEDVAEYLAPRTRRWYGNRGIPYRRGYLLYGAPGTGKSSLSLAMSGRFRLPIYIVSLNSPMMNEESLASLFAELPSRCVVLLEDIDTAGLTHTRDEPDEKVAVKSSKSKSGKAEVVVAKDEKPQGKISLSALLNVLDGVASQEGRVLVMTTNHVDKLDEALIRPGRVDMKIEFKLADRAMMAALFRSIYTKVEGDEAKIPAKKEAELRTKYLNGATVSLTNGLPFGRKEGGKSKEELAKEEEVKRKKEEEERDVQRIRELALKFADVLPEGEFSPAEIQGYLLKCKRHPERAIAGAEAWVAEVRRDKKRREEREKIELEKKEEKERKEKLEKEEAEKKAKEEEERKKKKKKLTNGVKKSESESEDD